MVTHAKRAGERLAVLYLDLDRFKVVNDSLGHASGDELLICVAHRVKSCVRESDIVARLGGDEFAVVLTNSGQSLSAAAVAHKILRSIEQPVTIRSQEVVTSSSIGVCVYPNDAADAESLLQNADIAMYRAKTKGTRVCFYTEDLNRIANERLTLENALRRGLSRDEFELHYQPRVSAQSHRVTSVEALVRWRRSEQELVMPGRFIALAEETGLIVPLGEWVLKAACAQMRAWRDAGHEAMRVAVNLSARQLRQPDFVETISGVLAECGLEPRHLELEITESVAMHDPEEMRLLLKSLSDLGVHLAIDDFGTGQSSLAYLKRFHLDYLKIDQSFVHGIHKDEKDESIVRSIIALGKNLRLVVIAEGVESEEQRMFLETEECDEMQGFLFGMPRPAAEVVEAFA
jgi:diguanylate cyclase (GGDEF)-like protein